MSKSGILFGPYGTVLEEIGKDRGLNDLARPLKILEGGIYRDSVLQVAKGYAQYADVATTNTFGLRDLLRHGQPELYREAVEAHYDAVIEAISSIGSKKAIYVALGPYGECYNPNAAPATFSEAKDFHAEQLRVVSQLPEVERVLFETVCTVREAVGIALAAKDAGIPVVISFVVDKVGRLLSGENLAYAIASVDRESGNYPDFYSLNCCPMEGLWAGFHASNGLRYRIGLAYPNASSKDPRELEEEAGIVRDFDHDAKADQLASLAELNGQIQVVGGCCGFDHDSIRLLAEAVSQRVTRGVQI